MDELTIRDLTADDRPAALALLQGSLGWAADAEHAAFYAWKHDANPFGPSFGWVAEDPEAGIVGLRLFLRWRFDGPDGSVEAVRAVDTATAPSHRGAGIFSRLTRHGLDEVARASASFVFNTPNDQSRPGYLKLGWKEVGRLPAQLRPRNLLTLSRVVRGRVPADLWSEPSEAGLPAAEALTDEEAVQDLLTSQPAPRGLRTSLSPAVLRWRYGAFAPLGYRALTAGDTAASGLVLFRIRQRGVTRECAIAEVLAPAGDREVAGRLVRRALRVSHADHALGLAPVAADRWPGFVRLARLGPRLTWRTLCDEPAPPPVGAWRTRPRRHRGVSDGPRMTAPVSVVITAHGRPEWLREAVGSVLEQDVAADVIVVDDCSPTTITLPSHPQVRIIRRPSNGGPAAARNTGLAAVTAPAVAFLDDDDLYAPGRLSRGLEALENAAFSICFARWMNEGHLAVPRELVGDVQHSILDGYTPQIGTVTLPLASAPRFDERIRGVEDVEWWLRTALTGPAAMVPEVAVLLRDHDTVRTHSTLVQRIEGRRTMLETHTEYFAHHPRALAFQLMRLAVTARSDGDIAQARRMALASLRTRPSLGALRTLVESVATRYHSPSTVEEG